MTRRGIAASAGALMLPLALCACGGDSTSGNTTGDGQMSTPAANAGAPVAEAPLADPCTLATTEVVSSTFSVRANGPNATQDAAGGAECTWTWLDPVQGPCAVIVAPRALGTFDFKSEDAEDISGVGDAAYREPTNDQPNNISARKGGSYVYIKMRCNGDGPNGNDGHTTQRQDTLNAFAMAVVENF